MTTMMRFLSGIIMVFLFIITLTDNVSAIRLNELEANPEGQDSGFEWVEIYSEENVNLEGYTLDHEGRGAEINLSGSFSGFFVIDLQNQWLRNSNETVYLKLNNNIIQTVGAFSDNKVEKTYGFCGDQWKFITPSKNYENSCDTTNTQTQTNTNSNQNVEEEETAEENNVENKKVTNNSKIVPKTVELAETKNAKISLTNVKSEDYEVTRTYKTRIGVIYFFIGFCVLLTILIALRKL